MGASDEIRAADQSWLEAFAAGDLESSLKFCADDCVVMAPNAPAAIGGEAIRELLRGWFKPGLKISWTPDRVDVSDDLGFSSGAYEMSFKDPAGNTISDHGKYVIVWKRQADGSWKVVRDISNSDLPQATSSGQ